MEMNLVLQNNYVELEQEEMMYVDGGWGVPTWLVKTSIVGLATAAITSIGGWGLKAVLASYSLRTAFVAAIVKGLGVMGIHIGNVFANKIVRFLAIGGISDFANKFANDLDSRDGVLDGWISW